MPKGRISSAQAVDRIAAAIVFDVTTDHPNAMYKCGEKAVFTVTAKDDKGAPLKVNFAQFSLRSVRLVV